MSTVLEMLSQPRMAITLISYLVFGLRLLIQRCRLLAFIGFEVNITPDISATVSITRLLE